MSALSLVSFGARPAGSMRDVLPLMIKPLLHVPVSAPHVYVKQRCTAISDVSRDSVHYS